MTESTEENNEITLDKAQEMYYNAHQEGNTELIAEAQALLDKHFDSLSGNEKATPVPEVTPAAEQPTEIVSEPTSSGVAQEGEPAKEGGTSNEDFLKGLPDNIRGNVEQLIAQNKYLDHYYRSNEGRVAALQRKADEATKRARELEEAKAQVVPAPDANTITNKELEALERTDPEMAQVIKAERAAIIAQNTKLSEEMNQIKTHLSEMRERQVQWEQERVVETARQELDRIVPGATQIIDSPFWAEFKNTLSPAWKDVLDTSNNPQDYANMMPLYSQWAEMYNRAHGFSQPTSANAVSTPAQAAVDPRAAQAQANRQQNLATGNAVSGKPATPQTRKPTIEELFKNPELLAQEQDRILKEEMKRLGINPIY